MQPNLNRLLRALAREGLEVTYDGHLYTVRLRGDANAPPAEALRLAVLGGSRAGIAEAVAALLETENPLDIINGPVMRAMAEVGKQFACGDLIVTEVLQSAEAASHEVMELIDRLVREKHGQG